MATYIVASAADSEKYHEAIGRLYAASINEVYPIRSKFIDGSVDPDITHSTFYWCDARPSADESQVAFPIDEVVEPLLGESVETTLGDCTLPSEGTELDDSWFKVLGPPP